MFLVVGDGIVSERKKSRFHVGINSLELVLGSIGKPLGGGEGGRESLRIVVSKGCRLVQAPRWAV